MRVPATFLALTHRPSPQLSQCELTCVERQQIDYERAVEQHGHYCDALSQAGAEVVTLDVNPDLPDSAFVEDAAVVLDEIVVLTTMGNKVRRAELVRLAPEIARQRPVVPMKPPGRLDGGDVLQIDRTFYVGLSTRTDAEGIASFRRIVEPHGYSVVPVGIRDCLHLKSGCTALDDETVLIKPEWIDPEPFRKLRRVPPAEPDPCAANVLRLLDWICMSAAFPRTAEQVRRLGYDVREVDISELAKAEAGLTCMSLLFF
jgi:dimethylargininase